jgi:hypothetical protein
MKRQFEPMTQVKIMVGLFIVCVIAVVVMTANSTPIEPVAERPTVNERAIFIMRCTDEGADPIHCACIYDKVNEGHVLNETLVAHCVLNDV